MKTMMKMLTLAISFSILTVNCDEMPKDLKSEFKKQKPTNIKGGLKDMVKQKVDFEKKKLKYKFNICQKQFDAGSTRRTCNKVVSWVTNSITGKSYGGLLIGIGAFFGVLFLGFIPVYRVGNRYRRYKKFSRDFRYFLKHKMSYAQSYGQSGEFSKDAKHNMKTSFRDFFIPGERRQFFVEVTKKSDSGEDETVKIGSKAKYATMDMAPFRLISYKISQNFRYWFKILRFVPFMGSSMEVAARDSDKQDMLERDIENSDELHFFYKPFKKEFREYFHGNIWKQEGEVDDPKDRLEF